MTQLTSTQNSGGSINVSAGIRDNDSYAQVFVASKKKQAEGLSRFICPIDSSTGITTELGYLIWVVEPTLDPTRRSRLAASFSCRNPFADASQSLACEPPRRKSQYVPDTWSSCFFRTSSAAALRSSISIWLSFEPSPVSRTSVFVNC